MFDKSLNSKRFTLYETGPNHDLPLQGSTSAIARRPGASKTTSQTSEFEQNFLLYSLYKQIEKNA